MREDDADSKKVRKYLIRRQNLAGQETKDAKPTAFSAGTEAETLANAIASRHNLRKVKKGKGKGWTPVLMVALRRTADEATFLAALERRHEDEERAWATRYQELAAKHDALLAEHARPTKKKRRTAGEI